MVGSSRILQVIADKCECVVERRKFRVRICMSKVVAIFEKPDHVLEFTDPCRVRAKITKV